ncbi:MAG: ADP-ribosylglycohydrolase family protein [Eubacterium sp.]|nr:ADP-ribosylglycohydrolase family protein [Eubacterium sp.]
MLGAIFGDIVGSVYEFDNTHDYRFVLLSKYSRPTDDSCMTLAVARALMDSWGKDDFAIRASVVKEMQTIGRRYPDAGYGGMFYRWLRQKNPQPYNSFGNGSGMRVSPAGWLYKTLEDTLHAAKLTAEVTHNHPEGIKGAQAIAASICQRSVPEAIIAFLEGEDYEDTIRKAISLGGDSDTIACMAGGIAEAYFGMPSLLWWSQVSLYIKRCPSQNLPHLLQDAH